MAEEERTRRWQKVPCTKTTLTCGSLCQFAGTRCCLQANRRRGHVRMKRFSGLTSHGPLARVSTHRRTRCRPASAHLPRSFVARHRYRPAWRLWSDGICTHEMTLPYFLKYPHLLPYGPACPGRTDWPILLTGPPRAPSLGGSSCRARGARAHHECGVTMLPSRSSLSLRSAIANAW